MNGKRAALSTVLLAVLALLAGGLALRDRLREAWYIHRLRSPDGEIRLAAAERIADLKLLGAVPELIAQIGKHEQWGLLTVNSQGEEEVWLSQLAYCVYRIGRADEQVVDQILEKQTGSPQRTFFCTGETDRWRSGLSLIKTAWTLPDEKVSRDGDLVLLIPRSPP